MVSTRGVRYKFSEGERVLCYEPDPTKAKVLYDSKVLEVIESKDKRGRRTVEYLIHFQGWNSSWDRCVSEDFVLKDTEENRQLQRDLAEKSQLQLGAYLYRRERKKGGTTSVGAGPTKRIRHGFSDDGSSSSPQPDEVETGDTDSSSASGTSSQSPLPVAHVGRAQINLPSALRDRLTFDYHLVVKRGRLAQVPASPNAAQILEWFVKWFARAGAWHPPRRADPPQRPDLLDVSRRLNLVREVADGLRVYFDFVLRGHLLYKQELEQYHEVCGQYIEDQPVEVKTEPEDGSTSQEEATISFHEEDMKSPKIPEYSHLPPDPSDGDKSEASQEDNNEDVQQVKSIKDTNEKNTDKNETSILNDDTQNHGSGKTREGHPATKSRNITRRLRSHKSAVSPSEVDDPAPSTSAAEPRTFETLSSSVESSGSSISSCWPPAPPPAPAAPSRTPLSLLLDKVAKWELIPKEGTEHLPCRIYGAIHLARLFVKLPDFLNATQMPDFKLKLILKHIDMFVQYLEEHGEWFGEVYYVADNASRSH